MPLFPQKAGQIMSSPSLIIESRLSFLSPSCIHETELSDGAVEGFPKGRPSWQLESASPARGCMKLPRSARLNFLKQQLITFQAYALHVACLRCFLSMTRTRSRYMDHIAAFQQSAELSESVWSRFGMRELDNPNAPQACQALSKPRLVLAEAP